MLKEAIEYIISQSAPHVQTINGEQYSDKRLTRIPCELMAAPIEVHTLTAILDYIMQGVDGSVLDGDTRFVLHVQDYDRVTLTRELNRDLDREKLVTATDSTSTFPFGRWLSVEDFIVGMQAYFVPDGMVAKLVELVSNITDSRSVQQTDDGMTQSVTAKTGVVTRGTINVPNPVTLRPLCTFCEIKQPERRFVFRLRAGRTAEEGVTAALFEADGNAWKRDVILGIRDYFAAELPDQFKEFVTVLA